MAAPTPSFSKGYKENLQRLYDANEGDVNFVCGPLNKNVHSFLLGAHSKTLDMMLKRSLVEGHRKRIEIEQPNPYLGARMLQHFYGFDYCGHKMSIGDDEESSYVSELDTHVQMYALADGYDVKDLKAEALWKFEKAMDAQKGHGAELASVVEVIPTVYETTPVGDRGLRDIVVAFGAENLERMKDLPDFKIAATRVPGYVVEVLPGFLQRLEDEKKGLEGEKKRVEDETERWKKDCLTCKCGVDFSFGKVCCTWCGGGTPLGRNETLNTS